MIKLFFPLLGSVLLFLACDTDFFDKELSLGRTFESEVAITAQLTNTDTFPTIFISKTLGVNDFSDYEIVSDANVLVEIEGNSKRFVFNPNTNFYEYRDADFTFLPNQQYRLLVDVPKFAPMQSEQVLLSSPSEFIVDTMMIVRKSDGFFEDSDYQRISLSFIDPVNVKNYYMVEVVGTGMLRSSRATNQLENSTIDIGSDDNTIEYNGSSRLFFTDNFRDGQVINLDLIFSGGLYYKTLERAEVRLISTTREGYLYQLTTDKYNDNNSFRRRFAEPVISFSNIENGVGIFSVSDVKSVVIE